MYNNFPIIVFCYLLLASSSNTLVANEPHRTWQASAGLGFSLTSGNTETTSINTVVTVIQDLENWQIAYKFDGIIQKSDGESTADKKDLNIKAHYKLQNTSSFFFTETKRQDDKFGLYKENNTISIGYGQQFYDSDNLSIKADIGPGFSSYTFNEPDKTKDNSYITHMAANLKWIISDSAEFNQSLIIDSQLSADRNRQTVAQSTLTTRINDALKMTFDVKITNNSKVQIDKKKTDTISSINLVYAF